MPSLVVCPKCQARYQLPETMLGKAIKCKKCSTSFVAKVPPPNQAKAAVKSVQNTATKVAQKPAAMVSRYSAGASAEDLARFGISAPLVRQADPMAENLSPPPKDILGNFASDPGFVIPQTDEEESDETSDGSLNSVIENPFVTEAKQLASSDHNLPQQGFGYSDLQAATRMVVISYGVMTFAMAVAFATPIVFMLMDNQSNEQTAATVGFIWMIAFIVLSVAQSYYYIAGSLFSYQGHENLKQLGIKPNWNPVFAGFAWFIPLGNIVIPLLTTIELANESDKFGDKKSKNKRTLGLVWGWWVASSCVWIALVVYVIMAIISAASLDSFAQASLSEGFALLVIFAVIIIGLMVASMVLIQKIGASVSTNQQKQWRKLRKTKKVKGHAAPSTYPPVYVGMAILTASVPLAIFGIIGLIMGFGGIATVLGIEQSPIFGWIFLAAVILLLLFCVGVSIKGIIVIVKGLMGKPGDAR